MPRDGALVLSDIRTARRCRSSASLATVAGPTVWSASWNCGNAKLTDLLQTLANCPKARSPSIHDRCKVVFEQLLP